MRSVIAANRPRPDQSRGMPKIPATNATRIPTMMANFQLRVLFMKTCRSSLVVSRSSKPPAPGERLTTSDDRLLPFLCRRHRHHRRPADFQLQIVGRDAQRNGVIFEAHDRAAQTAAGRDLVARLQLAQHGLPLLLPALLRKNQQEIEN